MSYARHPQQAGSTPRLRHASQVANFVLNEARKPGAYLVPLRVFIGLGWLRAAAEKLVEPGWRDGSSLETFLIQQVESGATAFPFYEGFITGIFLTHSVLLGYVVMAGQLAVGLAIVTGAFTSAALLGGIFMNVNFLVAGVPDPSAFYIVIQIVLLATHAGLVLGLDTWLLSVPILRPLATQELRQRFRRSRLLGALYLALAGLTLVTAATAFRYITDFSPSGSIEDPAAITVVLLTVASVYWVIACLRLREHA